MEWQPIETAPKDGTRILAFEAGEEIEVMWWEENSYTLLPHWHSRSAMADNPPDYYLICTPTHWMPLPEPPTEVE